MSIENERIARLEMQVKTMQDKLEADEATISTLNSKVNRAESWGRGFMYAMLMLGGVMTQIDKIKDFVKNALT